jgi:hypothetical protein
VPNALYLNARFNGSGPLDDAGAQVWDFDFRSGLLRNVADGSCVGAAPREVSANVWFKTLAAGAAPGATALLLINFADAPQTLACDAGCLVRAGLGGRPAGAALAVRDVWARTDNGTVTVGGGFSAVVIFISARSFRYSSFFACFSMPLMDSASRSWICFRV